MLKHDCIQHATDNKTFKELKKQFEFIHLSYSVWILIVLQ